MPLDASLARYLVHRGMQTTWVVDLFNGLAERAVAVVSLLSTDTLWSTALLHRPTNSSSATTVDSASDALSDSTDMLCTAAS